eukprot:3796416-Alexandrium_andersonii.AAC.1
MLQRAHRRGLGAATLRRGLRALLGIALVDRALRLRLDLAQRPAARSQCFAQRARPRGSGFLGGLNATPGLCEAGDVVAAAEVDATLVATRQAAEGLALHGLA